MCIATSTLNALRGLVLIADETVDQYSDKSAKGRDLRVERTEKPLLNARTEESLRQVLCILIGLLPLNPYVFVDWFPITLDNRIECHDALSLVFAARHCNDGMPGQREPFLSPAHICIVVQTEMAQHHLQSKTEGFMRTNGASRDGCATGQWGTNRWATAQHRMILAKSAANQRLADFFSAAALREKKKLAFAYWWQRRSGSSLREMGSLSLCFCKSCESFQVSQDPSRCKKRV
jgi:hypothetical protein